MENIVFNAKMIGNDECTKAVIAPLVDDYLNHLTLMSTGLTIREFGNAVVLTSRQSEGFDLMLVLGANSYDYDRTVGIVNMVHDRLIERVITPKYDDCRDEVFDIQQYFTPENEDFVLALRKDVVANVLDDNLKYCYVSLTTRKSIMNGKYKVYTPYEIQANLLEVLRGVTAMPPRKMICDSDLERELSDEELRVMDAQPENLLRDAERKPRRAPYLRAFDGKHLDAKAMFNPVVSDEDEIEEILERPTHTTLTTTRQTVIEDFER